MATEGAISVDELHQKRAGNFALAKLAWEDKNHSVGFAVRTIPYCS
jgi:hypothetical protein